MIFWDIFGPLLMHAVIYLFKQFIKVSFSILILGNFLGQFFNPIELPPSSEKLSASASEERMMNLPRHLLLLLPRVYYSRSKGDAAKVRSWVRIPPMLNLTNFVDDGGGDGDGDSELFKYVDLGMRDKLRAKEVRFAMRVEWFDQVELI